MSLDFLANAVWRKGQLLAFSGLDGQTDYDAGLVGRTVDTPVGLEIRDPGFCRIRFDIPGVVRVVFGGDFFEVESVGARIRGALLDAHHLLIEGPVSVGHADAAIRTHGAGNRLLVGTASQFRSGELSRDMDSPIEERSAWLRARRVTSTRGAGASRTGMRALALMKGQVYSPQGVIRHRWTTPDRWPHKDMWLWDTAFHAIGWRHVDAALAMEMVDGMFDLQREDGFLTYRGGPGGLCAHLGDLVTQPPVLAHAAQLVHKTSDDDAWLERLYPKLAAYVEWDLKNRDTDGGGMAEWFIEDDETCRSGESGMDNSPRFDAARRLDAVDFNAFLARECEVLAEMAGELGHQEDAQKWASRHRKLCELLNVHCWSEEDGFYFDWDPQKKERATVWSSAGFLPLLCGAPNSEQAARLAGHLRDPERFGTRVPVPSVAVSDRGNYSKDMWRGPMWVNINWLIACGFERHGQVAEATRIRDATLEEIERACEKFGVFFEYYDDRGEVEPPQLLRKGTCSPESNPYRQVIHEFGWTAALYIDLLFREK